MEINGRQGMKYRSSNSHSQVNLENDSESHLVQPQILLIQYECDLSEVFKSF